MKIGDLASAAGVNPQTVRYYEKRGLLPKPRRTDAGYRRYDSSSIVRLRFIRRAQAVGFSLREIDQLLSLRYDDASSCNEVKHIAAAKATEVRERIAQLRIVERVLNRMIHNCDKSSQSSECALLDALENPTLNLNE